LQSAVMEAQRCFDAPLDHTRHRVLSSAELQDNNRSNAIYDPERTPNASLNWAPPGKWHDIGLRSTTLPGGCKDDSLSQPPSSLSLVVIDEDGTRVSSFVSLPSADQDDHIYIPVNTEDTLTMRTSSWALADELRTNSSASEAACAEGQHESVQASSRSREVDVRGSWQLGSVLEVFSASLDCWYPALVVQKNDKIADMLTVQFWLDIDDAKTKTLRRLDGHLAPLGTNCGGQLPPGFQSRSSKSRLGQSVFLDATNGLKYESAELAWAAHFQRWLECRAPVGSQTIRNVAAVVAAAALPLQTSLPTSSKMDTTAAQGLVTEYAMSREPLPACDSTRDQCGADLIDLEQPPILAGLVTEYESDWNAVPQGAFEISTQMQNQPDSAGPCLLSPGMSASHNAAEPAVPQCADVLAMPSHDARISAATLPTTNQGTRPTAARCEWRVPVTVTGASMYPQSSWAQTAVPVGMVTVP